MAVVLLLVGMSCGKRTPPVPMLVPDTAAAADSDLTADEAVRMLREHNRVRKEAGVKTVIWSESLAAHARKWAQKLAADGCLLEHRPRNGPWRRFYGENLFMGTASHYGPVDAVLAWEREKALYSGEPISEKNVRQVGHYTQMVWKKTREIGCGKAECRGRILIVCNYDPAGNILGETPF